jgi:NAD-dependent deacetylase
MVVIRSLFGTLRPNSVHTGGGTLSGSALESLRGLLEDARRIAVFTGAGISTESGIPDFRSPGGLWTKNQPIDFSDYISSADWRREAWRRKIATDKVMGLATPNRGHRAVAELLRRGRARAVVTQNIDNLHQASGVPDRQVIELHGNATYASCLDCGDRYELAPILDVFAKDETLPVCVKCEGIVKTATISFGQMMPEEPMRRAREEALACDLFLVLGSSLVVLPAAGFPELAKQAGARLVIINRDPTQLDRVADLVINDTIGPVLGTAVGIE